MARPLLRRRSKYSAKRVVIDGVMFDSKREAHRYSELRLLHRAGQIANLEIHPQYEFIVNGVLIGRFRPDFRYIDLTRHGRLVVEDVKSGPTKTEAYGLRKKLLLALHDIALDEVM